jgi:hypothetical protein
MIPPNTMKTFATAVVLSAIFVLVSRSEDDRIVIDRGGGMLVQEEVQSLLTGAVSLAILKDDVELLKKLRLMGWDPKKPLGQSNLINDGCQSLHAAAISHSSKTVEWLITEVGIEKDKRGKNNEYAISLVDGSDQDAKEVIRLLARPSDGGLTGLIDAVLDKIGPLQAMPERRIIVDASDTPDPNLLLKRLQIRYKGVEAVRNRKAIVQQLANAVDEIELITISIKKVNDAEYRYTFSENRGPMAGHGANGTAVSKHGYWITSLEGGYDS